MKGKNLVIVLPHGAFHHHPDSAVVMLGNSHHLGKTAVNECGLLYIRIQPGILDIHHNTLGIGQDADLIGCFLAAIHHDTGFVRGCADPDCLDLRHGASPFRKACRLGTYRPPHHHAAGNKQQQTAQIPQTALFYTILHGSNLHKITAYSSKMLWFFPASDGQRTPPELPAPQ